MNVFLTWSGSQSEAIATAWYEWLPLVLQSVIPFFSSEDVRKGSRWAEVIGDRLKATSFGLICLTRENLAHPWIYFEAGAIAHAQGGRVAVVLSDLTKGELPGPLQQFQATNLTDPEDVYKLLRDLNAVTPTPLDERRLRTQFDKYWPDLSSALESIAATSPSECIRTPNPEEKMLEQILTLLKEQQRPEAFGVRSTAHYPAPEGIARTVIASPPSPAALENFHSFLDQGLARDINARPAPGSPEDWVVRWYGGYSEEVALGFLNKWEMLPHHREMRQRNEQ
jgi:hypothetical protein